MKIGLISDTHGYLDQKVKKYFADCDEIWHAGDLGHKSVLDELLEIADCRGVLGNIDERNFDLKLPENNVFLIGKFKILIRHIAGKPPSYNAETKVLIRQHRPNILICGHSHILLVQNDKQNNLLFINPGAAGNHGFHKVKTIITFEINETIEKMNVIELGKRGEVPSEEKKEL